MKHWPEALPKELVYPHGKIPIFEYLRINAKKHPDKAALIFYGREISYKELDDSSDRFANYLISQGLQKGDRVGLFMGNCPQYVIAHFGTQKMGGIVCPVNPMFKELELKYEVNDAGMSVLVTMDLYMPVVNNIINDSPTLKKVIFSNFNDYLPAEPTLPLLDYMKIPRKPVKGADDFVEVIKNADSNPPVVEIDIMTDICLFEYTGGSTGLPKGAMLSHNAHLFKAVVTKHVSYLDENSVILSTMPYFHIAGMLFMISPIIAGATNVSCAQFDPLTALQAIDKYKVTYQYTAVPANVAMMSHPEAKNYDLSSLKLNLASSFVIALNEEISKQWYNFTNGCALLEGAYGLSETHTGDTLCPPQKIKYGSMGIPTFETEFKIVDPNNKSVELGVGEQGEIALRSPSCMNGYWNKPEATAETLIDGFVFTGDVGMIDKDGYLWWMGRFKEMMKVSGHSVFPEDVESLVNQHPAVMESAVISVPDAKKGEVVKVFIILHPNQKGKVTEQEIINWAKDNMTPHKAPAYVEFKDELPKSGVKLLRRILRDEEAAKSK